MVIGKKITYGAVGETMKEATAIAIDDTGGLIIELPDGEKKTLSTGEITIRLK
jgi:biotin-(acetyl-CoA carboxylase) ligase